MKVLNRTEFMLKKSSDTLVIMGCGYSINSITKKQWNIINGYYDQIGINQYCYSKRDTTFMIVRERSLVAKKPENFETVDRMVDSINSMKTTCIVKLNQYKMTADELKKGTDRINHDGIILNEVVKSYDLKSFRDDMFDKGLHHGKCTLCDALHFAVFMKYNRILFCGVDLYDYRYFWLGYDETRKEVAADEKTCEDEHAQAKNTIGIIENMKKFYPGIKMMVHNPKSLLAEYIEVWK